MKDRLMTALTCWRLNLQTAEKNIPQWQVMEGTISYWQALLINFICFCSSSKSLSGHMVRKPQTEKSALWYDPRSLWSIKKMIWTSSSSLCWSCSTAMMSPYQTTFFLNTLRLLWLGKFSEAFMKMLWISKLVSFWVYYATYTLHVWHHGRINTNQPRNHEGNCRSPQVWLRLLVRFPDVPNINESLKMKLFCVLSIYPRTKAKDLDESLTEMSWKANQ